MITQIHNDRGSQVGDLSFLKVASPWQSPVFNSTSWVRIQWSRWAGPQHVFLEPAHAFSRLFCFAEQLTVNAFLAVKTWTWLETWYRTRLLLQFFPCCPFMPICLSTCYLSKAICAKCMKFSSAMCYMSRLCTPFLVNVSWKQEWCLPSCI